MTRADRALAAPCLALALAAPAPAQARPELVMREGAALTATTARGTITVTAGRKLERKYRWRRCELDASMAARGSRWMGRRGIYDPSPGFGLSFLACEGISRTVVEEAQIHFASAADAAAWLARYATIYPKDTVWTGDGLVLAWSLVPRRDQLNVTVLQICIRGRPPAGLAGASERQISLAGSRHDCVPVAESVLEETRRAWDEHWRQVDERRERDRLRSKGKE